MKVIHSQKSDSPGYTRHFFDEPIGTADAGVLLTGSEMKLHRPQAVYVTDDDGVTNLVREEKKPFEIILHGQQYVDLPNEINELSFDDGTSLKLGAQS